MQPERLLFSRSLLHTAATSLVLYGLPSLFPVAPAFAGGAMPSGGHYVAGMGSIGSGAGALVIRQASTTGIIDWNSFSIGKSNSVTFDNGAGATLNEVTGGAVSTIAGSLHASGSVYLINQDGIIVSGSGKIVTGGSFVASTQDADGVQRGTIAAEGVIRSAHGNVRLSAKDVSVAGRIAVMRGGQLWLTSSGTTSISGTLDADNAHGASGTIVATGRNVDVAGTGIVSASGAQGGTILIGGDIHGGAIAADDFVKANVAAAQSTTVAQGAKISADASKGMGGDIVIWSDGHTTFDGTISAKGETAGGFSEVSSHDLLGFQGAVDLTARSGETGTLLLDPENVTISSATSVTDTCSSGVCTPTGDNSVLNVTTLENALSTSNVEVTTGSTGAQTGDITVAAPLTWSANTLTLDAYHSISVTATISATGTAGLALKTNDGGTGGDLIFDGGNVTFAGTSEALTINGNAYTLLDSMAAVQAINASSTALDGNYALANALDASTISSWTPIGTDGASTVGNSGKGFAGTFEGLGNTISNLTIKLSSADYVGLFGYSRGTIRDVGMVGGAVSGGDGGLYVGGLVGSNAGTVINAYATGAVSGGSDVANSLSLGGLVGYNSGTVSNSYATGAASGGGSGLYSLVGGLVGYNNGAVANSYATGNATGETSTNDVGALVGANGFFSSTPTVSNSYATGTASGGNNDGGLVGENFGTISNSYATGAAGPALQENSSSVGGLVGKNNATIVGSYATGAVEGGVDYSNAGGFVGWNNGGTISDSYSTGAVSNGGANYSTVGGFVGYSGEGTITDCYSTGTASSLNDVHVDLGGFVGSNEGDISGSYATGAVSNSDENEGYDYVGGFAGFNSGTITQSSSSGTVSSNNTYQSSQNNLVGGLVGENTGTISQSHSTGAVSNTDQDGYDESVGGLVGGNYGTIQSSFSTGAVSNSDYQGDDGVGGLVGFNIGTISQSYSTGSVSNTDQSGTDDDVGGLAGYNGGTIKQSYSLSAVSNSDPNNNGDAVGGLVGYNDRNGTISTSAWDAQTSGQGAGIGSDNNNQASNVAGLTTAQLQGTLPSGFDNTVWGTGPGLFPYLLWQFPSGTPQAIAGTLINYGSGLTGIDVLVNGSAVTPGMSMISSANGYYYLLLPPNSIGSGSAIVAYTTGSSAGASVEAASGSLDNFDIAQNTLIGPTSDTTYSSASATSLQTQDASLISQAVGTNNSVKSLVAGLTNYGYFATGNGFTIDEPLTLTNGLYVQTTAGGANITVADALTVPAGESLALTAAGNILLNANVSGAGNLALSAMGAGSDLAIDVAMTGATINLESAGTISEGNGGVITAQQLQGSAAGSAALNAANAIANLGEFTLGNGDFSLTNAAALSVDGAVTANGNVSLTTTGANSALTIEAPITGNIVDLESSSTITSNGVITAAVLMGSSVGSAQFNAVNAIATLGAFTTNNSDFSLTNGPALTISGAVNAGTGDLTLATTGTDGSGSLTIDAPLTGATVTLTAGGSGGYYSYYTEGNISQSGAGIITADTLTGSATGNVRLTAANNIANLGQFTIESYTSSNDFELTTAGALTISGDVYANGTITLAAGDLTINAGLSSGCYGCGTGIVTLNSAGTISGSGGAIVANSLTGSSVGDVILNNATNLINTLGPFSTGGGNFILSTASPLAVGGALNAGAGEVVLMTIGAGNDLTINAPLTGGTVDLVSAGTIASTSAGIITATDLAGSASGAVTLNAANAIAILGGFTTSDGAFSLTDAAPLAIDGAVSMTDDWTMTLTTTGAGNGIAVDAPVSGHTLALVAAGAITSTAAGIITAAELSGSAVGDVSLNAANAVKYLGPFTTANGDFSFTNSQALTVDGDLDAGSGNLDLTTTSGFLAIRSALTGAVVDLVSADFIGSTSTGVITAGELTGSSVGRTSLNAANNVTDLGAFTTGNGDFSLNNAGTLTVEDAVDTGAGVLALTTTGAGHDLDIDAPLTGWAVELYSANSVASTAAGVITATELEGSSGGAMSLNAANAVDILAGLTIGSGDFSMADASSLSVNRALDVSNGNLSLATTGSAQFLVIRAAVTGNAIDLMSAGFIGSDSAGVITASDLTGTSNGRTTLNADNAIDNLETFATGNGDFSLTNTRGLTVSGAVAAGTGLVTLTSSGVGDTLEIDAGLAGAAVDLVSAGAITQSGAGVITSNVLTGSSSGAVTLNAANAIRLLGFFTTGNGDLSLTDASALSVTQAVNAGTGNLTLATTGANDNLKIEAAITGNTVNLLSGGAVEESASGGVTAALLNVSADTGITLTSSANNITTIGTDTTNSGPNTIDQH